LTTGEVQAHMAEVYGADIPWDTISRITDRILEEISPGRSALSSRSSWSRNSMIRSPRFHRRGSGP